MSLFNKIILLSIWCFRHDESKLPTNSILLPDEIDEEMSDEMNKAIDPTADPMNIEKDILRYYYYIHNGIDTEHVAPLDPARIQACMALLPQRLRQNYMQLVMDLTDEVREDYMLSVKKAIVDFVLRDTKSGESSDDQKKAKVKLPEYRAELEVVPKPWRASYFRAKNEINKNLFLINSCMAQLLKLWHTSFKFVIHFVKLTQILKILFF